MLPQLSKIKGVHPGAILRRELKILNLKASELATIIGEHKQTISAILNKRRAINPKLSVKLSRVFKADTDYFMLLQASYDVKMMLKSEKRRTPNLDNIRGILFWDTSIDSIDWEKNRTAVIKRILERGNDTEINELISFYGKPTIADAIKLIEKSRFSSFQKNILEYDLQ